jgi:hypothetical protein
MTAQAASDQASHITQTPAELPCVDIGGLTTRTTPVEVYSAVHRCIDDHQYDKASRLFAVAGVYGRFDTQRVADESAHQIIPALRTGLFNQLDEVSKRAFQDAAKPYSAGSSELTGLCTEIRKLGPPKYDPTYMTSHGLSAITGTGGGLTPGFDAAKAWQSSLTNYLNCPD